jgi:sugar/nucleoside kinase (ribokinase family)
MAAVPGSQVACFSYLAAASLWKVVKFPKADHGAEIYAIDESLAADGPMVAAVLAGLGQPTHLLTNHVGDNGSGAHVLNWLRDCGVITNAKMVDGRATPEITVVGDNHHTRTFFPYLPGVAAELEQVDLSPLGRASFAYIDGYRPIAKAASRAILAAKAAELPLLLNLGGDSPSEVFDAIRGYKQLIAQTSISESHAPEAQRLAGHLRDATQADWVVMTAGANGAVAVSCRNRLSVPAYRADVLHTHCAGAAFSAGLIYGLLHDWEMPDCLELASASGAMRCERMHDDPMPTLDELREFMTSRQRLAMSAA